MPAVHLGKCILLNFCNSRRLVCILVRKCDKQLHAGVSILPRHAHSADLGNCRAFFHDIFNNRRINIVSVDFEHSLVAGLEDNILLFVECYHISRVQPDKAVIMQAHDISGCLRILVVAVHQHRTSDTEFTLSCIGYHFGCSRLN